MAASPYVWIYTANGALDGEMIRAFLESRGIHVFLDQESYGVTLGLAFGPLGEARIYVSENQANEAKGLLAEMESGALESADVDNEEISEEMKNNPEKDDQDVM